MEPCRSRIGTHGVGNSKGAVRALVQSILHENKPAAEQKKIATATESLDGSYLIEMHGGTLTVESEQGEGTTFTMGLPTEETT